MFAGKSGGADAISSFCSSSTSSLRFFLSDASFLVRWLLPSGCERRVLFRGVVDDIIAVRALATRVSARYKKIDSTAKTVQNVQVRVQNHRPTPPFGMNFGADNDDDDLSPDLSELTAGLISDMNLKSDGVLKDGTISRIPADPNPKNPIIPNILRLH